MGWPHQLAGNKPEEKPKCCSKARVACLSLWGIQGVNLRDNCSLSPLGKKQKKYGRRGRKNGKERRWLEIA